MRKKSIDMYNVSIHVHICTSTKIIVTQQKISFDNILRQLTLSVASFIIHVYIIAMVS